MDLELDAKNTTNKDADLQNGEQFLK